MSLHSSQQQQQQQNDGQIVEEEDALVRQMEAMMMDEEAGDQDERLSFADSERFDDDDEEVFSAQASESSSLSQHYWRGWARGTEMQGVLPSCSMPIDCGAEQRQKEGASDTTLPSPNRANAIGGGSPAVSMLADLAAKKVASALSFECIENTYANLPRERRSQGDRHLPEHLVLPILRYCFPASVENIRLYSCLTNCGDRLYSMGEQLFLNGAVSDLFQIGYHLSAVVNECFRHNAGMVKNFDVSIHVDRCRIVSCSCSCPNPSFWCQHAVAACLHRIQRPDSVQYRPAIWDSITSLAGNDLKKLAQYLINELPKEYIPVAQKLIDALKDPHSEIRRTQGAPDPTAGPPDDTPAVWCMDERALHEEVRKTLVNFMRPSVIVTDVQNLSSPPSLAHVELWSTLHRTLCTRQPESMWNLLGMVRLMLSRRDANAPALLHVLTDQCLALDSVLLRWYQISLSATGHWHLTAQCRNGGGGGQWGGGANAQQSQTRQHNMFLLCQELTALWRLVALNPRLNPVERERLWALFQLYQRTAVARVWAILGKMATVENNMFGTLVDAQGRKLSQQNAPFSCQHFPGFFPALEACRQIDWTGSELQRLLQGMELGLELQNDIKMAQRQSDRFLNLPFLRDSPNGVFLIDLVEMEQQLGTAGPYNPDTVVLPPKSRRKKKKRRGNTHQQKTKKKGEKENGSRRKEDGRPAERDGGRRDSNENEQLSEGSSEDEQQQQPGSSLNRTGMAPKRREPYEDALDEVYAQAHAEIGDPLTLRLTCCEALYAQGYFREALQLGNQLAKEMLANQPNLLAANIASNCSGDELDRVARIPAEGMESLSEENGTGGTISSAMESGGMLPTGIKGTTYTKTHNHNAHPTLRPQQEQQLYRRQFSASTFRRRLEHSLGGGGIGIGTHSKGWLICAHPRLMASSLLTRETFSRTLFLARLLIHGEQFYSRKRAKSSRSGLAQTQSPSSSAEKAVAQMLPEPGHFQTRALELMLATLRNPRGPAATKLLEMEINHLEGQLFDLLRTLELCPTGLRIVRSLAQQQLRCQSVSNVTVPPTRMAHYVWNALSYTHHHCLGTIMPNGVLLMGTLTGNRTQQENTLPPCQPEVMAHRVPADDHLALELALQVLSKDVHISEADHPLLCECIRRHRKDLQMTLLIRNKDAPERLARVLATVLDQNVHRMYEDHHRSNVDFFLPSPAPLPPSSSHYSVPPPLLHQPLPQSSPPLAHSSSHSSSSNSSPSASPFQPAYQNSRRNSAENSTGNSSPSSAGLAQPQSMMDRYLFPGPMLANQASEAQAHHMFEFAKSLYHEAGGNQNSAMFNVFLMEGIHGGAGAAGGYPAGGGGRGGGTPGPHRNLHICALLIGLYALGLNNECSPFWNMRTYSTHVSWIQQQALDIGRPALEIIRHTWRKHLTPTEVASLADNASQSADPTVVEEAAQLALSVLPEANALLPTESQKALNQCKERSTKMLEEACMAVEKAAERGQVYPEVLFRVAHHWYDLYLTHLETVDPTSAVQHHLLVQQQHFLVQWTAASGQQQHSLANCPQLIPSPWQMCPLGAYPTLFAAAQQQPPAPPTAAALYSPSMPPPAYSSAAGPMAACRLQPSFSAPNMSFQPLLPPPPLFPPVSAYGRMVGSSSHWAQPQPLAALVAMNPPSAALVPSVGHHHQQQQNGTTAALPHRIHNGGGNQGYPGCHRNDRSTASTSRIILDERAMQLLKNAHRVGTAAMNNLRSIETASAKFAQTPPSCPDIIWLLNVSLEIGDPEYVRLFCEKATVCVCSPFVLFELVRAVFKFFHHSPNSYHRVLCNSSSSSSSSAGQQQQVEPTLQSAASELAKLCLQQAKATMAQHSVAAPAAELALHAILCCFNAAMNKLNYNNFTAPDQEYVCDLAVITRDLFRLIPPYHHDQTKRKYMDLFMDHMKKQKKFKSIQSTVHSRLQQPRQLGGQIEHQHQQPH